jgi:hypothetical protein
MQRLLGLCLVSILSRPRMTAVKADRSHRKPASAGNLEFVVTLYFDLLYFVDEFRFVLHFRRMRGFCAMKLRCSRTR